VRPGVTKESAPLAARRDVRFRELTPLDDGEGAVTLGEGARRGWPCPGGRAPRSSNLGERRRSEIDGSFKARAPRLAHHQGAGPRSAPAFRHSIRGQRPAAPPPCTRAVAGCRARRIGARPRRRRRSPRGRHRRRDGLNLEGHATAGKVVAKGRAQSAGSSSRRSRSPYRELRARRPWASSWPSSSVDDADILLDRTGGGTGIVGSPRGLRGIALDGLDLGRAAARSGRAG